MATLCLSREDLLQVLFHMQLTQQEILACLDVYGWTMFARHLRRLLANMNLRRSNYSNMDRVVAYIHRSEENVSPTMRYDRKSAHVHAKIKKKSRQNKSVFAKKKKKLFVNTD